MPGDAAPDARDACALKENAYRSFLAAHVDCSADSDCAVVGDCGPSLFVAVRADVAEEASALQENRCGGDGVFDGPIYDPVCTDGTCQLRQRADGCCGCQPPEGDAGSK